MSADATATDGTGRLGASGPDTTPARGAQGTVRRLIVFTILFVLVTVAASGVAGLFGRLLEAPSTVGDDPAGLALSLAFALIGGPLAAVLWWFLWRRLEGSDRASVAWGLYLAAITTVALVTFTTSLLAVASDAIGGSWSPSAFGTGAAWLLVWMAHRLMAAHPRKGPLRLATVAPVLGAAYGLILAAGGAIAAATVLFDAAALPDEIVIGAPWWRPALQSAAWSVGGAIIWWWHWQRDRVRDLSGGFADVILVLTGILGAAAVSLGGLGTALYVALRAIADRSEPWPVILEPLGTAVAAAGIGAIVWIYHRGIVGDAAGGRGAATLSAARLVEAGLGLVSAASGIGVIVNALLATLAPPLAGEDPRALLLGGIAALLVGAPVWWWAWRPGRAAADAGTTGRRVYLVTVFGVSAVVAIVSVLIIGSRIFEVALDSSGGNIVERTRAPFGLLLATALVAAYHFAVWRRDRALVPPSAARAIDRVIVVAGGDASAVEAAVREATGASVTVWGRADVDAAPSPETVLAALSGVRAHRVMVLVGAAGDVEAVPLRD